MKQSFVEKSPPYSPKDKGSVVITGASAGVGRATARIFAAQGYKLGIISRPSEGLKAAEKEIRNLGVDVLAFGVDVSSAHDVEESADRIEQELGPIEIWINNAMISVFSPVSQMLPEEYKRITEVNYLGYVNGTLAALKYMRKRGHGTIVQVGSALAYRSIPLQSAYCASKFAIRGFTDSLRCELFHEKSKIHICMVQMPALNTPQFSWVKSRLPFKPQPVPPIFQPEVAAKAILFASQHPRRELWVGLSTWKAIVGTLFFPGLLDRYLGKIGFAAQQTKQATEADRQDNVWVAIPEDRGAHGTFDKRAHSRSWCLELDINYKMVAIVCAAFVLAFIVIFLRR